MATIGLDKLYYAKITEDEKGDETYATPKLLAKAISADLSVELNEATLMPMTALPNWSRSLRAARCHSALTISEPMLPPT